MLVEWIVVAVVVAAAGYFVYRLVRPKLDVNNDGVVNKADVEVVVEKATETAKKAVEKATDKTAAKVKKTVGKTVKKAGRPKKSAY